MPQLAAGITAFFGTAIGATTIGSVFGQLALSVAFSALQAAMMDEPPTPGMRTENTLTGGANPLSFPLGRCATAGVFLCPPMTHGDDNSRLTYVIGLSGINRASLSRIIVDGEYVPITGTVHPDYGNKLGGDLDDHAWIQFRAVPTVADPMLLAKYGSYPKRPWNTNMVGPGTSYAILTFLYNTDVFGQFPQVQFEMDGIPLYDPRKDTSVGGSGAHRWNDRSTWEPTDNPAVMIYSILRGIDLHDGSIWGGVARAKELPLASWFAAMNKCDEPVSLSGGGTEPRYRAGMEVLLADEPFAVIGELLKACHGSLAEVGGTTKIRVGGPGASVLSITDDDLIISNPQEYEPFPGLGDIFNGVEITYPAPGALWQPRKLEPIYDATYQAEDDNRLLVAQLDLASVPYARQARRLGKALIKAERRFARHVITLPPKALILEPLDVISWTSDANGYTAKRFDVTEVQIDPGTLCVTVSLREVNPDDYDWNPADEITEDDPSPGVVRPAAETIPGFAAAGVNLLDDNGDPRRPAVKLTWTGNDRRDVRGIEYELRRFGDTDVIGAGSRERVDNGQWVLPDRVISATSYEVRARFISRRRRQNWSAWASLTTPKVFLDDRDTTQPDIEGNLIPNGKFKFGDLRHWIETPSWMVVRSRADSGLPASCPTQYCVEMTRAATPLDMEIARIAVDPGDTLALRFFFTFETAPFPIDMFKIAYYDADGAFISRSMMITGAVAAAPLPWFRISGDYADVPAAAETAVLEMHLDGTGPMAGLKAYASGIKIYKRREAEDRIRDSTLKTKSIASGAVVRRSRQFTSGSTTLTTTPQTIETVTNSTDQDAANEDAKVEFTYELSFTPDATPRRYLVTITLNGPGGFSRSYRINNSPDTTTNASFQSGTLVWIVPGGNALPDTFNVRAEVNINNGTVSIAKTQLVITSHKKPG
jgi:hypothetical protein